MAVSFLTIYNQKGFEDREAYLHSIAERFEVNFENVRELANILGAVEDFDGLPSLTEDFAMLGEF